MWNFLLLLFFSLNFVSTSCKRKQASDLSILIPCSEQKLALVTGEQKDVLGQAGLCKHLKSLVCGLVDHLVETPHAVFSKHCKSCHRLCFASTVMKHEDIDPFSTFKNLQSPFKLVDVLQPILTKHVMKSGLPRVIEQYGCRFYHYKSDSVCNSLLLNRLLKNAMLDMQMQQRHCSAKPVCQVHDTRTHNNNVICSAIKNVLQNKCRGYYT